MATRDWLECMRRATRSVLGECLLALGRPQQAEPLLVAAAAMLAK